MSAVKNLAIVHGRKGYIRDTRYGERPYLIRNREFGCLDGLASAYLLWKAIPGIKIFPTNYGEEFPWELIDEHTDLIIADFSYPREVLLKVKEIVNSIIVLDHHQSAEKQLEGLDFCQFDMTRSGAVMVWDYFHPGEPIPEIIQYVQDYDLWAGEFTDTDAVICGIEHDARHRYFRSWDKYVREGVAFLRHRGGMFFKDEMLTIEELMRTRSYKINTLNGHRVAFINFNGKVNHLLHAMSMLPDVDYALSYFFTPAGKVVVQFRGNGKVDVSEVAVSLGGGGHPNAAGVTIPPPDSFEFLKLLYSNP